MNRPDVVGYRDAEPSAASNRARGASICWHDTSSRALEHLHAMLHVATAMLLKRCHWCTVVLAVRSALAGRA